MLAVGLSCRVLEQRESHNRAKGKCLNKTTRSDLKNWSEILSACVDHSISFFLVPGDRLKAPFVGLSCKVFSSMPVDFGPRD